MPSGSFSDAVESFSTQDKETLDAPSIPLLAAWGDRHRNWLCIGATVLPTLKIAPNASPVFLIDALRMGRMHTPSSEVFDDRWKTFPQDFPSAGFLKEHGIRRVLLIQDTAGQPAEDLAHVLLEAGISLHARSAADINVSELIHVNRPTRFRTLWHRALALMGLSRALSGGFGAWPHGSGGG